MPFSWPKGTRAGNFVSGPRLGTSTPGGSWPAGWLTVDMSTENLDDPAGLGEAIEVIPRWPTPGMI
jgi:hypothetical protein